MIWSSTSAMVVIDMVIIAMIVSVVWVSVRYGVFEKGRMAYAGRFLILGGITVIGLFYVADLAIMCILPFFMSPERVTNAMHILHLEVQWYTSLATIGLIGSGIIMAASYRRRVEEEMARSARQISNVQQEIVQSEVRFRSLIEQTPDAVYCLEFRPPVPTSLSVDEQIARSGDAILVECNQVFADSLGIESPALALGTRFGELDSVKDTESHARFYRQFIENGYRLSDYELNYTNQQGETRALRISFTGVIQNGDLVRIWGAEIDILEQKQTTEALHDRRRFHEFVGALSSRLIKTASESADETLTKCLERSCRFFAVDRGSIVWFDKQNTTSDVLYFWNEHGGPPWVEVSFDNYPWMSPQILAGSPVCVSDVEQLPPEAARDVDALKKLGLKSVVAAPLVISNETMGVITFGNIETRREWSEIDLADVRVIADLFANVVNRMKDRKSLNAALAEIRSAKERLEAENVYLRQEISTTHGFDEIVGESPQLTKCLRQVEQVAATNTAVLIQGETGTGKELIARAIHERSDRRNRPLVKVNCAALPANLIESELFGHEKGAFTGALTHKRGRFDLADGGTLFLDEIGDFPLELQGKLLRVIQEGEFERLGGTETVRVDVRLIAATNRHLQHAVDSGEFRADLYYRINTFPIYLPRLADRGGDVPILAEHFAKKHAALLGKDVSAISASMMQQLAEYTWPGNVRELEGVIQRALISSTGPVLEPPESLQAKFGAGSGDGRDAAAADVDLSLAERAHIERVLNQARWVIGGTNGAAAKLGIPPSTLRSKMKKLGIVRPARIR